MRRWQRIFLGRGALPEPLRSALVAEGVLHLEEGLVGRVRIRGNQLAPAWQRGYDGSPSAGAIVLTRQRLHVWAHHEGVHVDAPLVPWPRRVTTRVEHDRFVATEDTVDERGRATGDVTIALRTPNAERLAALLREGATLNPVWQQVVASDPRFLQDGLTATIRRGGRATTGAAAVAVTTDRLVVWAVHGTYVDVPLVEGRPTGIDVVRRGPSRVVLSFAADAFHDVPAERVEVELVVERAAELAVLLHA